MRRCYLIGGRVQGVGFRFFAQAAAAHEGLHGFARNLPDGRVEIEAEGDTEAMERFEHKLRHGPPGARVAQVEIDDAVPTGRDTGFNIR